MIRLLSIVAKISYCDPIAIQMTRKYLTETKIFIKISIIFKNLFQSMREKLKVEKKILVSEKKF